MLQHSDPLISVSQAGRCRAEPPQPGGGLTARGDPADPSARSSSAAAKIKRLRLDQKAGDPGATMAKVPRAREYTGRRWDCRLLLIWLS